MTATDPFPVDSVATITDHDGTTIDATYRVVRSYWPAPVCEVVGDKPWCSHLTRQSHDRMTRIEP